MQGKILSYTEERGYGFISNPTNFRQRIFFHLSKWTSEVAPAIGQIVDFELGPGSKPGLQQAVNIVLVEGSALTKSEPVTSEAEKILAGENGGKAVI